MSESFQLDRRTTIKWVLAAAATLPAMQRSVFGAESTATARLTFASGYGTDPVLNRMYGPGDLWPLTLTTAQRRTAAALCDLIIPADAESPSAASVGVVDFLDEWISAPYPLQQADRQTILAGLAWLDSEATRRFGRAFADMDVSRMTTICDEISHLPSASEALTPAATFFARFRDLTAGGFYTTPDGMRDIRYVGNVALARFDGPPAEVLSRVGLSGESV